MNQNQVKGEAPLSVTAQPGGHGAHATGAGGGAAPLALSIIILNYNTAEHVRACLVSLPRGCAGLTYEVIVVDNASPRPGIGAVVRGFPGARLIQRRRNGGFSAGVNTGLRAAAGDAILVLNPDTTLAPGAAASLVETLHSDPLIGIAGPRLLNPDGSLQLSCRRFPGFSTALFNRYSLATRLLPRNRYSAAYLMTDWEHTVTRDVDWLSGAAMLLNRMALERVGLFDERYFFAVEDVDLCQRMHRAGYRVVYEPRAVVTHLIGGSSRTAPNRVILARHAGMWRYYKTYHSTGPLLDAVTAPAIAGRCAFQLGLVNGRRLAARFARSRPATRPR